MTEHEPIEVSRDYDWESRWHVEPAFDALLLGIAIAIAFAVVDIVMFDFWWQFGLGLWCFMLVGTVFALSEQIVPGGQSARTRNFEPISPSRGMLTSRQRNVWIPPSPFRGVLVILPILGSIAIMAFVENQIPISFLLPK